MFVQSDGWDFKECHSHLVRVESPQYCQAGFELHCLCVHPSADRRWKNISNIWNWKLSFLMNFSAQSYIHEMVLLVANIDSESCVLGVSVMCESRHLGSEFGQLDSESRRIQLHLYFLNWKSSGLIPNPPFFLESESGLRFLRSEFVTKSTYKSLESGFESESRFAHHWGVHMYIEIWGNCLSQRTHN